MHKVEVQIVVGSRGFESIRGVAGQGAKLLCHSKVSSLREVCLLIADGKDAFRLLQDKGVESAVGKEQE